jgi:hypothetical protein
MPIGWRWRPPWVRPREMVGEAGRHPALPDHTGPTRVGGQPRWRGLRGTATIRSFRVATRPVLHLGGVAQFGRALRSQRRGRRFKSDHLHQAKPAARAGFAAFYGSLGFRLPGSFSPFGSTLGSRIAATRSRDGGARRRFRSRRSPPSPGREARRDGYGALRRGPDTGGRSGRA